jgi:hypothetical protein
MHAGTVVDVRVHLRGFGLDRKLLMPEVIWPWLKLRLRQQW